MLIATYFTIRVRNGMSPSIKTRSDTDDANPDLIRIVTLCKLRTSLTPKQHDILLQGGKVMSMLPQRIRRSP